MPCPRPAPSGSAALPRHGSALFRAGSGRREPIGAWWLATPPHNADPMTDRRNTLKRPRPAAPTRRAAAQVLRQCERALEGYELDALTELEEFSAFAYAWERGWIENIGRAGGPLLFALTEAGGRKIMEDRR